MAVVLNINPQPVLVTFIVSDIESWNEKNGAGTLRLRMDTEITTKDDIGLKADGSKLYIENTLPAVKIVEIPMQEGSELLNTIRAKVENADTEEIIVSGLVEYNSDARLVVKEVNDEDLNNQPV